MTARCEDCYCEVPDEDRRCTQCRDVLGHSVASALVYAVTYFGALGLLATGAWIPGLVVAAVGAFTYWRARQRIREIRLLSSSAHLPRATLLR